MTLATPGAAGRLPEAPRIAVVGGGVIGLSLAWRLAERGAAVSLYECGKPGSGASWAAAGMLAAGTEAGEGPSALLALCRRSQALWPSFAAQLEAASGRAVGLRLDGLLIVATVPEEAERLRLRAERLAAVGVEAAWLDARVAHRLEPLLAPTIAGALLVSGDGQVKNRALASALAVAATRAGARIVPSRRIVEVLARNGAVRGLRDADGALVEADMVVLAAGAWSAGITLEADGERAPFTLPVRPVKGQMLALTVPEGAALPHRVLWGPDNYLVPRLGGHLLVGATMEEAGFDARLTAEGVKGLLVGTLALLPAARDWTLGQMWTGFRPATPDGLPILGRGPVGGLFIATGHHRNGILLAPVTAELLVDLLLKGREDGALAAFSPLRFVC